VDCGLRIADLRNTKPHPIQNPQSAIKLFMA
jgi:hypothetical protein